MLIIAKVDKTNNPYFEGFNFALEAVNDEISKLKSEVEKK